MHQSAFVSTVTEMILRWCCFPNSPVYAIVSPAFPFLDPFVCTVFSMYIVFLFVWPRLYEERASVRTKGARSFVFPHALHQNTCNA